MATQEIVRPSELLAQLARDYHRVQQAHAREARHGATRRKIAAEMERIAHRFERVLDHWSSAEDEELREVWRVHLYEGGPPPDAPTVEPPCSFKGETDAGARLEIRPASDGGYDIMLDGARIEHSALPWHLNPEAREPFRIGEYWCRERFDAPPEAVRALARFVATPESVPPWRWAAELFQDGLIDSEFALTPRGRRALVGEQEEAGAAPEPGSYCVIAADAGRARILTLEINESSDSAQPTSLVEISDLSNPARRARDRDLFSDTRPGLRREGAHGPRHAVDDGRASQRQEADKRFAELVAEQAEAAWRRHPTCHVVLVAPPRMLGTLRPALARRHPCPATSEIEELDKDLSQLAPAALHDALAQAGLLPARARPPTGRGR
jgi:protein required for attachment to host cells